MANLPPPPWTTYFTLMVCSLVALDKIPGVRPVGIGDTLSRSLFKLVMRAAGDEARTSCGKLQLCAGFLAGIEGTTHALGKRRLVRARQRRREEEARIPGKEEDKDEVAGVKQLTVEPKGK